VIVEEDYCGFVPETRLVIAIRVMEIPIAQGFIILQWLEGDIGEWRRFAMMEYCSV